MPSSSYSIAIRRATSGDERALGRLGAMLVQTHHGFDPRRFFAATAQTERGYGSFLVSQIDERDIVLLVAEDAGEVIGYTYAGVEGHDYMALRGPAGVVHDVVVDPARRGQGVGRALLAAAISALEERGVPRTVLWTAERNEPAQRLFESVGFRRTMLEMTKESDRGSA